MKLVIFSINESDSISYVPFEIVNGVGRFNMDGLTTTHESGYASNDNYAVASVSSELVVGRTPHVDVVSVETDERNIEIKYKVQGSDHTFTFRADKTTDLESGLAKLTAVFNLNVTDTKMCLPEYHISPTAS